MERYTAAASLRQQISADWKKGLVGLQNAGNHRGLLLRKQDLQELPPVHLMSSEEDVTVPWYSLRLLSC